MHFTIALHTVVAFLSLCGAILLSRPDRGVVAIILGNTPGGMVARRMWPILVIVVLLGSFRTIGRNSDLFGAGFATALFVLSVLLILVILICWIALSLNRTDRERRRAEQRLAVLVRVSELIRTIQDPYELSYEVAKIVGVELDLRRCLFNETDVENDLEIVHRVQLDACGLRSSRKDVEIRMRQTAVFAFIVTSLGWMRLRNSLSRIHPSRAALPIDIATTAKAMDSALYRASCPGEYCETDSCMLMIGLRSL